MKTDRRYEGEEMRKIACAIAMVAIAFFIVAVVDWELKYPSESDPKNAKYVLWKTGLYRMNPDSVTNTMIGDGAATSWF